MALGRFARRRCAPAEPPGDTAPAGSAAQDREDEERRLGVAVLKGDVPPIWYRQRLAALAAEQATDIPAEDAPSA